MPEYRDTTPILKTVNEHEKYLAITSERAQVVETSDTTADVFQDRELVATLVRDYYTFPTGGPNNWNLRLEPRTKRFMLFWQTYERPDSLREETLDVIAEYMDEHDRKMSERKAKQ